MKNLIASTPATGHLNPLLPTGRILIAEGHEVVGLSGGALRDTAIPWKGLPVEVAGCSGVTFIGAGSGASRSIYI
jgi:UDP:flavonoid glycosyltransferase YjiC (YdhE family)